MLNHPSIQELKAKYIYLFVYGGFNQFIYIPSFSLGVYLVLAESKIEKQFSSQIFLPGLTNIWKLIKVLTFIDTSLKISNADRFVMRIIFQF